MNWVGHVFKGYMGSDTYVTGKSFAAELFCVSVYDNSIKRWMKVQNMCAEYTEKNALINTQIIFLSLMIYLVCLRSNALWKL